MRTRDREKNYIQAILQALPVGLAIVDTKGGTVLSNAEFDNVWGYPPVAEDVSDYSAYKAWWGDGRLVKPEEWASSLAIKGQAVLDQQLEIQRFDGRRAFVLNSAVPVYNSSGSITGAVVTIMDITEQRVNQQNALSTAAFLKSTLDAAPAIIWTAHDSECRKHQRQQGSSRVFAGAGRGQSFQDGAGAGNAGKFSHLP